MKKVRFNQARLSPCSAIAMGFAALCLSACSLLNPSDPFSSEYYTSNFIASLGFDVFDGANPTVPPTQVSGMWDFPYRYETGWGATSTAYMKLVSGSTLLPTAYPTVADVDGVPSGLSSTATVYRLEVVNLVNSSCDFEGGSPATGWTTDVAPTTQVAVTSPSPLVVFGNQSMNLYAGTNAGTNGIIQFIPPSTHLFPTSNSYNAFFRYINHDKSVSVTINGSNQPSLSSNAVSETTPQYAVDHFQGSGSAPVYRFFSPVANSSFTDVRVDNFRVSKNGGMELRMLLKRIQTNPTLVDGVYSFSVWVHPDLTANASNSSPYNLDAFVLTMRATAVSSLSVSSLTYSYVSGSGWKKLTATLKPGALQFDSSSNAPVLELVIGCNDTRPGGVFLAQPELRFYPNGL